MILVSACKVAACSGVILGCTITGDAVQLLSYWAANQLIEPLSWLQSCLLIELAFTAPLLHSITKYRSPPKAQRLSGPRPVSFSGRCEPKPRKDPRSSIAASNFLLFSSPQERNSIRAFTHMIR